MPVLRQTGVLAQCVGGQEVPRCAIQVIDLRIRRADLPSQNRDNIFKRMQTSRQQVASLSGAAWLTFLDGKGDPDAVVPLGQVRTAAAGVGAAAGRGGPAGISDDDQPLQLEGSGALLCACTLTW